MRVLRLDGTIGLRSEIFELTRSPARLHYEVQGERAIRVSIYVLPASVDLWDVGGEPLMVLTEPGQGSIVLPHRPGHFYVETVVANARWKLRVEQPAT